MINNIQNPHINSIKQKRRCTLAERRDIELEKEKPGFECNVRQAVIRKMI